MITLYSTTIVRRNEQVKFEARLHGAKFEDEKEVVTKGTVQTKKDDENFMFKDPKEYEHLSMEERKALTKKMMGKHRTWVNQTTEKTHG